MGTLRSKETEEKYRKLRAEGFLEKGCNLCRAPSIKDFGHWRIAKNNFPYDHIADVHDMIILKRHALDEEISALEKEEYESIKKGYIEENYQFIIEPVRKQKSIPEHAHLHLIVAKDR